MSCDHEQYIKQLEEKLAGYELKEKYGRLIRAAQERQNRMTNALTTGFIIGAGAPAGVYTIAMESLKIDSRPDVIVGLFLTGCVVGPTIAFIREKRFQKHQLQNQNLKAL